MTAPAMDLAALGTDVQMTTGGPVSPVRALNNPTAADQVRLAAMARAWAAYQGLLPDPLKPEEDGLNDNAKSNRLKPMVQKGASFLFPPTLTFSVKAAQKRTTAPHSGEVETGNADAQDFLNTFWKRNRQQALLHKLAVNGGVFGHAFLLLIPAADTSGAGGRAQSVPRLQLVDPQNVRVETAPGDCETVMCYVLSYAQYSADAKATTDTRKVIERVDPDGDAARGQFDEDATWRITDQHRNGGQNTPWVTDSQTEWPYPFPPLFDCQNLPVPNEYWGETDITSDLIEQNNAINFVQSNINRIIKWHGTPLTVAEGMQAGQIDRSPRNIVGLPPGAKLYNLEWNGANLPAMLSFLESLRANMDEQDRTPAVALGRQESLPKGNLSGVALDLLFQPLIEKTNQKRSTYGPTLEELCSAVLVLAGFGQRLEDVPVDVQWPPVLPTDPQVEWTTAALKQAAGVSKTTLLEEGGYDPDEQAMLRQEEQAADTRHMLSGTVAPAVNLPMQGEPGQPGQAPVANPGLMHPAMQAGRAAAMQAGQGQ